jgi:O-antigen/teichoic acid export membrane protein
MSKTALLAKNTLLIATSRVSTQLVMFFMLPLYTATLSPSEYGAVDLIITYAALFAPLIMLNVQQAIFRYLIDARGDVKAQHGIITNAVEITLGVALLVALVYFIAGVFVDIPFAALMAFYFTSFIVADLVMQIARGLGRTKAFAITGIAQGLLTVLLNLIFMLPLQMGANGMLLGMAIGLILPAIVLAIIIGAHHSIKLSSRDRAIKKQLLAFSLPLLPNTISWWVFSASDRTIISIVLGVAANGIYAVTNKFSNIANSFSAIFYASWSESAVLAINDPDRDKFFSRVANMMVKAFGSLGILIMCTTPIIFPLLVNEAFNEALLYLPVLILGTLFNTIVSFYSAIYIAKDLTKQVSNTSIIAAIINLVLCLALIWFIGIWAAAISTAAAYGVMAIYRHYDMKKYVAITYEHGIFIKLGLLFGVVSTLYYIDTLWASVVGFAIAATSAYWLNRHDFGRIVSMVTGRMSRR